MASLPVGRRKRKIHCKSLPLKTTFQNKRSKWSKSIAVPTETRKQQYVLPSASTSSTHFSDHDECEDRGESDGLGVSVHQKRRISSNVNWKSIHNSLLRTYFGNSVLPEGTNCVECGKNEATIRCLDCGFQQFFCRSCAGSLHTERNIFHLLEVWEDGMFFPLFANLQPLRITNHQCDTLKDTRQVVCFDQRGHQHIKDIVFCQCQKPAVTLLKMHMWPGSPEKPTCAFHLDLMEKFFLHCKTSLKEFAEVLQLRLSPCQPDLLPSLYSILNSGCFDEYRHFKYQTGHLTNIFPQLDSGITCPLCPKDKGILVQCMDACFGLSRKKSQGQHICEPKHGTLYFADQDDVDNFVSSYHNECEDVEQDCSKFHAGEVLTALRSKGKNKLLDEKAVFGTVCRHDYPMSFHSIKFGERIGYSIYELKRIAEATNNKPDLQVIVMYDIACTLSSHLKKNKEKLKKEISVNLDNFIFSIPIFHCYGHKASCQVKYSPRRMQGLGLTDGEGTERLWSFLRDFSRITKEMGPERRIDALTDGLLHYAYLIRKKMAPALCGKLLRAIDMGKKASDDLLQAMNALPVECDESKVADWFESQTSREMESPKGIDLQWDEKYVDFISTLHNLRNKLVCAEGEEDDKLSEIQKKLERTEKSIASLEKKQGLKSRWSATSPAFLNAKKRLDYKQRRKELINLCQLARERTFLLEMKRKYADGQAIAIKLSGQINKVVKGMKKTLLCINAKAAQSQLNTPELSFDDVKDANSGVYSEIGDDGTHIDVPVQTRTKLIELFCFKNRCLEEEQLVLAEMQRLESFYNSQIDRIDFIMENSTEAAQLGDGLKSILAKQKLVLCLQLKSLESYFSGIYCMNTSGDRLNVSGVRYLGSEPSAQMSIQSETHSETLEDRSEYEEVEYLELFDESDSE